jgi:urocanate hydratase
MRRSDLRRPFRSTSLARVLWNAPASGIMRHANAGDADAIACALAHGLDLPGILPRM